MGPEMIVAYLSAPGVLLGARVISDLLDIVADSLPDGKAKKFVVTLSSVIGYFGAGRTTVVKKDEKKASGTTAGT